MSRMPATTDEDRSEESPMLKGIRRLPLHIAQRYAGVPRISFTQFKLEHPDGFFEWEVQEETTLFRTLEEAGEHERKQFEPSADEIAVPYVLIPCMQVRLEPIDAKRLLDEMYIEQEVPYDYTKEEAESLQDLLAWWVKHHTKPWWQVEYTRIIVLLPSERAMLYKLWTGLDYVGDEPSESEFLDNHGYESDADVPAGDAAVSTDD